MKQQTITFLLALLMSMVGTRTFAYDIEVKNEDGVTIYYNWVNDKTDLEVTYRGNSYNECEEYIDNVVIPTAVNLADLGKCPAVTSIGDYAFTGCGFLTSVTISSSVTNIGEAAFWRCSSLTSVVIPNSVTSIRGGTFQECSNLTSVTIPSSVTNIGRGAFYSCSSLTSVTMPNSVTTIGDHAFGECSSLTSVTIPTNVTSIGLCTFICVYLETSKLP